VFVAEAKRGCCGLWNEGRDGASEERKGFSHDASPCDRKVKVKRVQRIFLKSRKICDGIIRTINKVGA
jgi:hypothetical protein